MADNAHVEDPRPSNDLSFLSLARLPPNKPMSLTVYSTGILPSPASSIPSSVIFLSTWSPPSSTELLSAFSFFSLFSAPVYGKATPTMSSGRVSTLVYSSTSPGRISSSSTISPERTSWPSSGMAGSVSGEAAAARSGSCEKHRKD